MFIMWLLSKANEKTQKLCVLFWVYYLHENLPTTSKACFISYNNSKNHKKFINTTAGNSVMCTAVEMESLAHTLKKI